MCPREGERSPRAYEEAQGASPRGRAGAQGHRQVDRVRGTRARRRGHRWAACVWYATLSGYADRANIEANDLARHPQFLSPDALT